LKAYELMKTVGVEKDAMVHYLARTTHSHQTRWIDYLKKKNRKKKKKSSYEDEERDIIFI
jgi:hypothetical protein